MKHSWHIGQLLRL
jgi:ATP-dependent DNA helicase PIF1